MSFSKFPTTPLPIPAVNPGFVYPEDYVLFGLLVGHGLIEPSAYDKLIAHQQGEGRGKSLFDILASSSELDKKAKANIAELLTVLQNPGLAKLLPATLPDIETVIQGTRTEVDVRIADSAEQPTLRLEDIDKTLVDNDNSLGASKQSRSRRVSTVGAATQGWRGGDLIGYELDGHVIISRLGSGAQGDVYLAEQLSLNRKVAIKKLDVPRRARAADLLEMFRTEARNLGNINHSNIVKIYEIFEAEGMAFFTMEHIKGKTIRELVEESTGGLPTDVIANIACQACNAMARTSQAGLIHRDIKPQNMMLDENGDLKIVDFGLAAFSERFRDSYDNPFCGTPQFASPEQFNGDPLTPLTDMYSLGATLYYAATGKTPFTGRSMGDLAEAHRNKPLTKPSEINNDIPSLVDRIIVRMMEKDPAKRYRSFNECFDDWATALARTQSAAVTSRQLLGANLLKFGREEKDGILKTAVTLGVCWLLVAGGAIFGERFLMQRNMMWVMEVMGDWGTYLLTFSLFCIFYVAMARRKWLPVIGNLRAWLYTHIVTAIISVAMLLVHSGNFLMQTGPGPRMGPPLLTTLMSWTLIITAVSGTVGLVIFRALRRKLIIQQMQLREGQVSERDRMAMTLSAKALSGWRLVHYPLAIFFIALSILHIVQALRFTAS